MTDREFLRRHGRYRGINDFFPLADVGRNLGELEPSHGPVYLVTDTPTFWVSNISRRGAECRERAVTRVSTRNGVAGPGTIVPLGGFQEYNRDAYIEQLLAEGRIRKCGSYRNNMIDYDSQLVREYESRRRKLNRSKTEKRTAPRSIHEIAESFASNGVSLHAGDKVYRITADRLSLGSGGRMGGRGDEITASILSKFNPDGAIKTALSGGIIEEVGIVTTANAWTGEIAVNYLKGKEPKEED